MNHIGEEDDLTLSRVLCKGGDDSFACLVPLEGIVAAFFHLQTKDTVVFKIFSTLVADVGCNSRSSCFIAGKAAHSSPRICRYLTDLVDCRCDGGIERRTGHGSNVHSDCCARKHSRRSRRNTAERCGQRSTVVFIGTNDRAYFASLRLGQLSQFGQGIRSEIVSTYLQGLWLRWLEEL